MKKAPILGILSTIFLLFSCQDPIFWVQVKEGSTPQHNLTKNAKVFDADASETHFYAIMGGWLYTRERSQVTWRKIELGGRQAYSLDVARGRIGLFDNAYDFDFGTETLGVADNPPRPMVYFDKASGGDVSQVSSDLFVWDGGSYPGRYLGVLGANVVSTVAVFSAPETVVNPDRWRNPHSVYGDWLIAGSNSDSARPLAVGETAGTSFGLLQPLSVSTARSVINEGFQDRRADVPLTVALVGITSGYREVFINNDGVYAIREPLTTVNDVNIYRASKMTEASVESFVFRSHAGEDVLFALTSNMGLWSLQNGNWIWE